MEHLRPPTSEELKLLLDNAQGRLRAAVRVFARTGLRLGELVALEPEDVSDGFIRIHRGKTKAAKRIVPVHSCIKADLENWLMKPMGRSALTRNFAELRDSLGISSDVTLHGLRKYVYAELISKEPRAFLVSRLVGHTVPAMMKVYGGLGAPKDLKEVIDKLDDL